MMFAHCITYINVLIVDIIIINTILITPSFRCFDDGDVIMAAIEPGKVIDELEPNKNIGKVDNLPKSAQEVYYLLCDNGALKPREIGLYTSLSNRTIRYALKILVDKQVIKRVPDLHDLRSHFYAVN